MLKSPVPYIFRITLILLFFTATTAWAQNVPGDLQVIVTAGGLVPDAEHVTVRIAADGQGTYDRFKSSDLGPALESDAFTLTSAEVEQFWQVIQNSDFFNLEAKYAADNISDGTFANLTIMANGNVHTVTTQNIALAGFDDIISFINGLTPGDADLVYDTSEPFTFTSRDICEQSGIQAQRISVSKKIIKSTQEPAAEVLTIAETDLLNGDAHSGTVVAYRITLEEAVSQGIVTLEGKGGAFAGDLVSISIDNSSNFTNDRLTLSLYLDLWGPAASTSNSLMIASAIALTWGGHTTTGGQDLKVDVVTRTTPGGTSAPGTFGFHQIKMVTDSSFISGVVGKGTDFDVNWGIGSGTWSSTLPPEAYAHEAGHLMGLDDRYEDYSKQPDDTWIRESDGQTFTSSALANEIAPFRPDLTTAEIVAKLEDPSRQRATVPFPGSGDDLMATVKGSVQQSDIDALAAQAGLIIEIRPGTILVNKDGGEQSFVIIRSEDIFVPPGGSKTLGGLYVACIDHDKATPSAGSGFDLAPSLSDWRGIETAQFLQMLVDYIDEQADFCAAGFYNRVVVWRITDNSEIGTAFTNLYLQAAGINVGNRILDFPRITNPNAANPNTSFLTPIQLFVPEIAATTGNLLNPGEAVALTGTIYAPSGSEVSTAITWSLDTPAGSAATLTGSQGETTMFTTDVHGTYQALLQVEVTDTSANSFTVETVAPFTVADDYTETFETGILESTGPFFWETSTDNPWIVNDSAPYTGVFSAASANIDDDGITTLEASFEQAVDGTFSFAYKVSSESSYDFLRFFVDGQEQGSWSGEIDWSIFSINLTAGVHTAIWTYEKDDSFAEGLDRAWIDDVFFPENAIFTSVGVRTDDGVPATYQLSQNYPNPFNPTTTITYAIPQAQHVTLVVYNALGRQVAKLVEGRRDPGQYQVQFDARGLSSGVYYYELRAGTFTQRKAMILLK